MNCPAFNAVIQALNGLRKFRDPFGGKFGFDCVDFTQPLNATVQLIVLAISDAVTPFKSLAQETPGPLTFSNFDPSLGMIDAFLEALGGVTVCGGNFGQVRRVSRTPRTFEIQIEQKLVLLFFSFR